MLYRNKLARRFLTSFSFFLLINLCSCGYAYEKQLTGKYYIIGVDAKEDLGLRYKLNSGDFISRAPGRLLQQAFNDTFLVVKTQEYNSRIPAYYILDMTKDGEFADEETFRVGPLSEDEFISTWKQKLNLQLEDVEWQTEINMILESSLNGNPFHKNPIAAANSSIYALRADINACFALGILSASVPAWFFNGAFEYDLYSISLLSTFARLKNNPAPTA